MNFQSDSSQEKRDKLYQSQKMEALGTLVAGVAHEINNPINLIMFNIPLFQKIWKDFFPVFQSYAVEHPNVKFGGLSFEFLKENMNQLFEDMIMAGNRVAGISKALKNFSKQTNVEDKKPIRINEAVENAIRLTSVTLKKSSIKLELELMENIPEIDGNLQNIEQVIINMIINAIEAINHTGGKIHIKTGVNLSDGRICLSISDNGSGINPSIADKIFHPFVTDKIGKGGTGLGLSVSYSIVKAHGGEITYKTEQGKGTAFTILFPSLLQKRLPKILIVDDDRMFSNLLVEALNRNNEFLINQAANGVEACMMFGTYRPNLAILDVFMPEVDGLEVCRTIKKNPELSGTKVIITTGFPNHPKIKEIMKLGYTEIFSKPFKLQDFVSSVQKILNE
ncbi:MAG: response regulator [Desulfobacterales bacterium]|nr:response regulator [Desulfobacterales bacterium]